MMIKGNELKELVSADMELHNALIEGLDYIFTDGWDYEILKIWIDFRQLLSFNKDLDIDSYEGFINFLKMIKDGYQRDWEDEAASHIKMLGFSISLLSLYKNCLVLEKSFLQPLQDMFEVLNEV
ncbi:hypothetical protein [Vibrio owensii]|uniref:hypothetical protein n=1 Tax=Vibrio owensii TaxID=696485 RepID=UPI00215D462B|nr:hypothetical protein [Vibrio owensii]MCR9943914.1 hypothetical protein [Vibrio owensii]